MDRSHAEEQIQHVSSWAGVSHIAAFPVLHPGKAAAVARDEGVTVTIRNGHRVYEINPTKEKEQRSSSWEEAFD
jgi:hypothetical protein